MMRALSLDRSFANGAVHYGTSCGLCHWNKSEKMIRIMHLMEPKVVFLTAIWFQSRGSIALTTRATISSIVALSRVSMKRAEPDRTRAAMSKLRT
jgi:hypothetical protein